MKEKAKTILFALLTPKTIILGLALYDFIVVWMEVRKWGGGLMCYLCPWFYPWSFTNEPTRLLVAACGLCLSMRWSYLAAIGLSGFILFQGISFSASLFHDGMLIESWRGMWQYHSNLMLSLHAQYVLASMIFVYAVVCFSKSIFRSNSLGT